MRKISLQSMLLLHEEIHISYVDFQVLDYNYLIMRAIYLRATVVTTKEGHKVQLIP
jgi:hypothetical protein